MVELADLPGQLMLYVLAAIRAYGDAVLDEAADRPADATAVQGRRLLQRIFGTHKTGEPLPGPLADAVANPKDKDTVGALRLAIRKKLAADPGLCTDVEGMLADAETTTDEGAAPLGELNKSLIGQAAAGVTLVAALIYAGGALTLIFKLWYLRVPWTPVLGQLPHDFIITTAFGQVILPTLLLAALLTAFSARYPEWYRTFTNRWRWQKQPGDLVSSPYLISIFLILNGLVLALFGLIWTISVRNVYRGVPRGSFQVYMLAWACVVFALPLFVYIYRVIYPSSKIGSISKHVFSLSIFLVALLPTVAAVSAATVLPVVTLCGPSFHKQVARQDGNGHVQKRAVNWIQGSLIGSNSKSIFIAQWKLNSAGYTTTNIINRIEVVPVSMVKAEIIGPATSDCTEVTKPKPTSTPSKSGTR